MSVLALPIATQRGYAVLRDRYLRDLRTLNGVAAATLLAYRRDLDDTAATIARAYGVPVDSLDLEAVSSGDLRDAVAEYHDRPDARYTTNTGGAPAARSRASIARRVSAIRGFFAWAHGEGHVAADPAVRLTPPRRTATTASVLRPDAAHAVLAVHAGGEGSRWPQRDLLVVTLGLCAGLRAGEIAALPLAAIDPARAGDGFTIRGKGGRERHLPLVPPAVALAVAGYLPTRARRLAHFTRRAGTAPRAGTLLLSSKLRRDSTGEWSVEPTADLVSYVANRALRDVLGDARTTGMGPHTFRHTFATEGARHIPLHVLQQLLGHADLATTQTYLHAAEQDLAAGLATHPLASLASRSPVARSVPVRPASVLRQERTPSS